MKSRLLAGFLLLGPMGAQAGEAVPRVFPYDVVTHELDNGLDVVAVRMPTPGVVAFATWMAVGSRDEVDPGRTGFAHFFEHLMFLGTPTWSADARERALLRAAADDNAWTWFDETVYHLVLPADRLDEIVAIEADRFRNLTLTPDDVRREAGAVYGEFRKSKVNPVGQAVEALYDLAFDVHTYGHDTIGLEADIAAMPTAHAYALAFHDRFYRPGNATVLAVGDVDPEAFFARVEAEYGAWEPGTLPRPVIPAEPEPDGLRRRTVDWPQPTAPVLALGWRMPAGAPDDPTIAALELLGRVLLADVGPLERRLVREEQLAFSVWGGRDDFVDPGLFKVVAELRPGVDPAVAEAVVREEIARLAAGVDPELLDAVRRHVRQGTLSDLDDPLGVLMALGWALRRDPRPDAFDRSFAALDAVTASDVQEAARRWLVDDRLSAVVLMHREAE